MSDTVTTFRFGAFTLVPSERLLLRNGEPIALSGRAFDVLSVLVRNHGHLVSKEQLLREVWPGLIVEEVNLSVNVSAVRKALTDSPEGDGWIETVPKRGYRFRGSVDVSEMPVADVVPARTSPLAATHGLATAIKRLPHVETRWAIIVAFAMVAFAAAFALRDRLNPSASFESVAVLPFVIDRSADDYIADGITESIINDLTLLSQLRVTPRTTAFRYRGATADPANAGRELRAAAVITGKIYRDAGKVRIQVDLVDVTRDSQAWGAHYQGEPSELVHLQNRIVHDLARRLLPALAQDDRRRLGHRVTANPDAYRRYLEARYYWNQRSADGIKRAIELFRQAIEIDPTFAMAYSGLSDCYTTLGYVSERAPVDAFPLAKQHALTALNLDPTLAEAHASLAYEKFYYEWDWAGADAEFKRAIALNPHYPVTHQWYSVYLLAMGRVNEALQEIRSAQAYDPLSLPINTDVGFHYYYTGQYAEATKQLETVLDMNRDFALARLWLGRTFQQLKRYDEALAQFRHADVAFRDWPVLVAARGSVEAASGRSHDAARTAAQLEAMSETRFVTSYGVALVYAALNDKESAFRWLEKAFDERSHWLVWLRLDPRWDNLRSDPRFSAWVDRMRFPS